MSSINNPTKKSKTVKRIVTSVITSIVALCLATVISAVCIYNSFFQRYERPNYKLYPGLYCYDRIQHELKRETFKIKSDENELQAYYYPSQTSTGLAVLAHGFHAGADDYLPLIDAIVERGYSVLTYDVTGVYSSGGDNVIGMCQSLKDLDNVLNFAQENQPFKNMPKFVIGHSWGGYAAASVLALHSEIKAAALLAPMNSGADIMLEKAEEYAGKIVYTTKPIIDIYQDILFGDYANYDGVKGINSTNIPVLIAQGVDDATITPDKQSLTAHLDKITNPNVYVYWGKGHQATHTGIWHSKEAEEYRLSVNNQINDLQEQLGREATESELAQFYSSIDHKLYSDVNAELIDLIISTFDKGLEL